MSQKTPLARKPRGATIEFAISLNNFFMGMPRAGICAPRAWFSNFYRIDFQSHHTDMDFPFRVRPMPGGVTFGDGGNEFLTQSFRHTLDVRQPGGAQPGGKTVAPRVRRILRREPDPDRFETKARQPFFVNFR